MTSCNKLIQFPEYSQRIQISIMSMANLLFFYKIIESAEVFMNVLSESCSKFRKEVSEKILERLMFNILRTVNGRYSPSRIGSPMNLTEFQEAFNLAFSFIEISPKEGKSSPEKGKGKKSKKSQGKQKKDKSEKFCTRYTRCLNPECQFRHHKNITPKEENWFNEHLKVQTDADWEAMCPNNEIPKMNEADIALQKEYDLNHKKSKKKKKSE